MSKEITKPKIIIVDENDKIIGYKERGSLDKEDIYRVTGLWITNSQGDILLAKRQHTKKHYPGKWGPAVSGTVEENESYEDNIIKETAEELGLKNIKLETGPKLLIVNDYRHFTQWYFLKTNKSISDFKIQAEEVEEIKWFSKKELEEKLTNQPDEFLPRLNKYFKLFVK